MLHFAQELGLAFQIADDLEDKEKTPTSILYYLSKEQASESTQARLKVASQDLKSLWGNRASHLTLIAEEVIQKTKIAIQ